MSKTATIKAPNKGTAILIFSRYAEEEALNKNFIQVFGKAKGIALADKLIAHTVAEANKTGLPVIQFFTDKQKGENFAERITHAVEMGFAAGFDNLIITGTDSPEVNCNQFKGVAKKLNNNNLILAPSKDGGVYIIGLQRKCFQRAAFKAIPWQSDNVFDSLKKLAEQNELSLRIEVSACDIDIAGELLNLQSNFCNSWFGIFASQLLQLFSTSHLPVFNTVLFIPAFGSTSSLRGPPVMLAV